MAVLIVLALLLKPFGKHESNYREVLRAEVWSYGRKLRRGNVRKCGKIDRHVPGKAQYQVEFGVRLTYRTLYQVAVTTSWC